MDWLPSEKHHYRLDNLKQDTVFEDPIAQFSNWYANIKAPQYLEPNAMVLSTAGEDCKPTSRVVLLKQVDSTGFVFFTNYGSQKAKDISENHYGALLFYWTHHERQVRIEGKLYQLEDSLSDDYFKTRPRVSQLAALASHQSETIKSRDHLMQKLEAIEAEYADKPIPRPTFWGGYKLIPEYFEFWQGRDDRLHDRIAYQRQDSKWKISRLSP